MLLILYYLIGKCRKYLPTIFFYYYKKVKTWNCIVKNISDQTPSSFPEINDKLLLLYILIQHDRVKT